MLGIALSPILKLLHIILGVSTSQNFPPPLETREEEETFMREMVNSPKLYEYMKEHQEEKKHQAKEQAKEREKQGHVEQSLLLHYGSSV